MYSSFPVMNCRVLRSLVLPPSLHSLPFIRANNNDIQLALCNYLFTQRVLMLIGSSKMCMRVCVWWECEISHWYGISSHILSVMVAALSLPLTAEFSVSVFCVTEGGGGRTSSSNGPTQNLYGAQRGTDKAILPPQALLFTYVHARIHTHICVCQLIITNCSSHQALAKWPSLSDVVRQAFPLKYHKHTRKQIWSRCWLCTFACVLVFACAHSLSVCMLASPPCINHCPPSNEDERTDSLKHLILPRIEPSEGMGARGRERKTLR